MRLPTKFLVKGSPTASPTARGVPAGSHSTHSTEAPLCLHPGEDATVSHPGELYQLLTCYFERTLLSLPIAPLLYLKVLTQGWAIEQTMGSFLFPHLHSSFCRPRCTGTCSHILYLFFIVYILFYFIGG